MSNAEAGMLCKEVNGIMSFTSGTIQTSVMGDIWDREMPPPKQAAAAPINWPTNSSRGGKIRPGICYMLINNMLSPLCNIDTLCCNCFCVDPLKMV